MHDIIINVLIVLCCSIGLITLLKRLNLPPAIAYFFVGILIGNEVLFLEKEFLELRLIGEIGIVFLLFTIGLELSISRLTAMYRSVLIYGTLQLGLSMLVFSLLIKFFSVSWIESLLLATAIALSSTAIVLKTLSEESAIHSRAGMLSTAILLFQDLAVIPALIIIPTLELSNVNYAEELSIALLKGLVALVLFLTLGKKILPKFLHFIAKVHSDELFVLSTLFIALVTATLTESVGLSMPLGAFLAGITLGESQYRQQILADIRPFRDILMGLFFISVGMLLEFSRLIEHFGEIIFFLIIIILLKGSIIFIILKSFGEKKEKALQVALMLPQLGEFGFVIIALLLNHNLVQSTLAEVITAAGILSMMLTPTMIRYRYDLSSMLFKEPEIKPSENIVNKATADSTHHVVICGYGRVGQTLGRFLTHVNIPYLAIDYDPLRVQEASAADEPVLYGDSTKIDTIKSARIYHAAMVIITFDNLASASKTIENIQSLRPTLCILARTKNEANMEKLLAAGATEVLPESLEASLMLCGHCLAALQVPLLQIVQLIKKIREDNYSMLNGFYHGEITDISLTTMQQHKKLHAVKLSDKAYAIGKSLRDMAEQLITVDVKSVRHDGTIEQPPNVDRALCRNDTLILVGEPHAIDAAETYLLSGT